MDKCRLLFRFLALSIVSASTITYAIEAETLAFAPPSQLIHHLQPTKIEATPIDLSEPLAHPPQNQLDKLHTEMMRMEALAVKLEWPRLNRTRLLSFGDYHPQVPVLREMLMHLGDLKETQDEMQSQLFDLELHHALIRFQKRHGAKADGILGPATRRQLNISPQTRAEQILLNIYRMNSFQPEKDQYIQVNVPDYKLHLFDQGVVTMSMKTIVGKRKRKTPIFSTDINRVVVNPSLYVPKSIAYKDILPIYEKDSSYLDKKNLKVITGWGAQRKLIPVEEIDLERMYKGESYQRLWEPPGEQNTLGKVKFLTNGPYSVYLHDTSARRLFDEDKRAFSSGCIRVEQPKKLADALLKMSNQLPVTQVDALFSQTETTQIKLNNPIKLYVTYWTSWVDPEGNLNFRDDLYRRDRYELSQLKKGSAQEIFITSN
jgi:murein L,D-transpeptidase YcbB/YkuD